MDDNGSAALEIWKWANDSIIKRQDHLERAQAASLAVIAAGVGLSRLGEPKAPKAALVFVGASLLLLFFYGLQQLTEILLLGGYKKRIEETLNLSLGRDFFIWELHFVGGLHYNPASFVLGTLQTLIPATAAFLGIEALRELLPKTITTTRQCILFLVLVCLFLVSMIYVHTAFGRGYRIARNHIPDPS